MEEEEKLQKVGGKRERFIGKYRRYLLLNYSKCKPVHLNASTLKGDIIIGEILRRYTYQTCDKMPEPSADFVDITVV